MKKFELNNPKDIYISFNDKHHPDALHGVDDATRATFYDQFYRSGPSPLQELRKFQARKIIKWTAELIESESWLDVGCGDATFISEYQGKEGTSKNGYGIDPSLRSPSSNTLPISTAALLKDPPAAWPKTFKVISLLDVLEHFRDCKSIFNDVGQLLDAEGLLLIKVPNKDSVIYRVTRALRYLIPSFSRTVLGRLYQVEFPPPHYYYYNRRSLVSLLRENGYEVVGEKYLSEMPNGMVFQRLWGVPLIFRCLLTPLLSIVTFGTPKSMHDGLLVWSKKTT